jgi:hypothetical protein
MITDETALSMSMPRNTILLLLPPPYHLGRAARGPASCTRDDLSQTRSVRPRVATHLGAECVGERRYRAISEFESDLGDAQSPSQQFYRFEQSRTAAPCPHAHTDFIGTRHANS